MIKRSFDFFLSLIILFFSLPVFAFVALLVYANLGSPVFLKQKRPGLGEKLFCLYKFRTMRDLRDDDGNLLADHQRLTRFGRFLRSTSLDELPELWNVLKGEMSLVGPRPLLVDYLSLYDSIQSRRHSVRPGITGWAQVNGRNSLNWNERFKLDVWYVENQNFFLDIKILFMTVSKVLLRHGISASGEATMSKFTGN